MIRAICRSAALLIVVGGCGFQSGSAINSTGGGGSAAQTSSAQDTPDRVVSDFMEAVRGGDDKKSESLLTPITRQKIAETQVAVTPPGSPTAKYKVGTVKYVTPEKDAAWVGCTVTDTTDDEGHTRTDEIVWVLRHESEGWRIAGMMTEIIPNQPPLILNFEDPEDMMRKLELVHGGASPDGSVPEANGGPQAKRDEPGSTPAR
jgi:hypothetical protein